MRGTQVKYSSRRLCTTSLVSIIVGVLLGANIASIFFSVSISEIPTPLMQDVPNACSDCETKLNNAKFKIAFLLKKLAASSENTTASDQSSENFRFGPKLSRVAAGAIRTSRDAFLREFDYGLPTPLSHNTDYGGEEVLIMYGGANGIDDIPDTDMNLKRAAISSNVQPPFLPNVTEATGECDKMQLVPLFDNQCVALVWGFGGHHILQWKRNKQSSQLERKGFMRPIPSEIGQKQMDFIRIILSNIDQVATELRPILERINRDNAVIIMTLNSGIVSFLINFVCSARSRGFDLRSVLVFATDDESFEWATRLGLEAYRMESLLGKISVGESKVFGDLAFAYLSFAKLVSGFIINHLGYDFLSQDLDVVWYKDPMNLFLDKNHGELKDFDMIFMDDGNHNFNPLRTNTGFYFVRYNEKTRFLLTDVVLYGGGEMVLLSGVDQITMFNIVHEHHARHGLQVKILDWKDFPGGKQYVQNKNFTNYIIDRKITPYIFHMHFTKNSTQKQERMRQSGMWFAKDECLGRNKSVVDTLSAGCCSPIPIISCHDKFFPADLSCRTA